MTTRSPNEFLIGNDGTSGYVAIGTAAAQIGCKKVAIVLSAESLPVFATEIKRRRYRRRAFHRCGYVHPSSQRRRLVVDRGGCTCGRRAVHCSRDLSRSKLPG